LYNCTVRFKRFGFTGFVSHKDIGYHWFHPTLVDWTIILGLECHPRVTPGVSWWQKRTIGHRLVYERVTSS